MKSRKNLAVFQNTFEFTNGTPIINHPKPLRSTCHCPLSDTSTDLKAWF
jgi:hypothetical protein